MLTLGGLAFLLACVFGSFIATGGAIGPLLGAMPFELLTILGAAIGTFVMANSMHDLKHTLASFGLILKGERYHKTEYVDLLSLLYWFTRLASQRGAMALEPHIEKPDDSIAFKHFDKIVKNHHTVALICDYLRLSADDRDECRRPASDRGCNGAGIEKDAGRGNAPEPRHSDHGGCVACAGDRGGRAGRD